MDIVSVKDGTNIYIDYKTNNVIIAKKTPNNSYSFYTTKMSNDGTVNYSNFNNLIPIDDIFEFLEQNNLEMDILPYTKK